MSNYSFKNMQLFASYCEALGAQVFESAIQRNLLYLCYIGLYFDAASVYLCFNKLGSTVLLDIIQHIKCLFNCHLIVK